VVEGVDSSEQPGRDCRRLDGAAEHEVPDRRRRGFADGYDDQRGRTRLARQRNRGTKTARIACSLDANDATEACVSSAGDTYSALVIVMLYDHRFRAMNTEVGVWLWSDAAEQAPIMRRHSAGRRTSLPASRRSSVDSEVRPRSID
jgi:hypothetical protein